MLSNHFWLNFSRSATASRNSMRAPSLLEGEGVISYGNSSLVPMGGRHFNRLICDAWLSEQVMFVNEFQTVSFSCD
jgi:hypothetical protein